MPNEIKINSLKKIESQIDKYFHSLSLPANNVQDATKFLCHVSDDLIRFGFIGLSQKKRDDINKYGPAIAFTLVDDQKYALRLCLSRASRLEKSASCDFHLDINAKQSAVAYELLKEATVYATVCRFFASMHEGLVEYEFSNDEKKISLVTDDDNFSYSALEVLASAFEKKRHSGNSDFFNWLLEGRMPPFLERELLKSRISKGRIRLNYSTAILKVLLEEQDPETGILPTEWKFPWESTTEQTRRFISSLVALMHYHVSLVHFGTYEKVDGAGVSDICLTIGKRKLSRLLSEISGLAERICLELITNLTWGFKTNNPDPALQPFMPLGNDVLLLPPFLILNNDFERNLLSLNSRIDSSGFNSQSYLFEEIMTLKLKNFILSLGMTFKIFANIEITSSSGIKEEIDCVLFDESSGAILALELRWMLQPGDPREVIHRQRACLEKVTQLKRKVSFLRENVYSLLDKCKIDSKEKAWLIEGIVLIDGFGGIKTTDPKIPILPMSIMFKTFPHFRNISHYATWVQRHCWCPRKGDHYTPVEIDYVFHEFTFTTARAELNISQKDYDDFLFKSIQVFFEDV